ncbi:hypothetical protein [Clostridium cochlearium]|uniref:Uncharacterized protein n=1 Tax=Clostridium cochlearium TaxID=1494 RepID=A0A2X2W7T1_CLOCO|nr:hypothetical protein [Clostridium cochlearium]SQB35507.1 Uncharacterised protein [Clostridium cochlearium]
MIDIDEALLKLKKAMRVDKRKMLLSSSFDEDSINVLIKDKYLDILLSGNKEVPVALCEQLIDNILKEI